MSDEQEFADKLRALAIAVLETEASAILALKTRIDDSFVAACREVLACQGRIIVSGVGKSGHIGSKIAATLSSTGSPAFFVHPAEASHGDLGMVRGNDVFIALSNSGRSDELMVILPVLKRLGVTIIAMTGDAASPLATSADIHLDTSVEREACPLGLAPTASTSATLSFGDALAVAVLAARGFSEDDFALSHPGGTLGKKLLLRVADVMQTGQAVPAVPAEQPLTEALLEISRKRLGAAIVTDQHNQLLGLFTDGDLRRTIDRDIDVRTVTVGSVMTCGGQTITADALAADAVGIMQSQRISILPVIDEQQKVCGVLHMHMLLNAGVV